MNIDIKAKKRAYDTNKYDHIIFEMTYRYIINYRLSHQYCININVRMYGGLLTVPVLCSTCNKKNKIWLILSTISRLLYHKGTGMNNTVIS